MANPRGIGAHNGALRLVMLADIESEEIYNELRRLVDVAGSCIQADFPCVTTLYGSGERKRAALIRISEIQREMRLCPHRRYTAFIELAGTPIGLVSCNYVRPSWWSYLLGVFFDGDTVLRGNLVALWMIPVKNRPGAAGGLMPQVLSLLAGAMRERGASGDVWTLVRTDGSPAVNYVRQVLGEMTGFGRFREGRLTSGCGLAGEGNYQIFLVPDWGE